MNQEERCVWLIRQLLREQRWEDQIEIPDQVPQCQRLLRGLMNVRPPWPADPEWLRIQDDYLQTELNSSVIPDAAGLPELEPGISLWQGDITKIKADAIVNAVNNALLGCFIPNHGCIDNAIHSFAGIQLRLECDALMNRQGHEEPVGHAKLTRAYNLPCSYVLHTVGPVIQGRVSEEDRNLLASCYRSCLETAAANGITSVAFCCVSTGVFHFPNRPAAEIAVKTVREFLEKDTSMTKIVFNVFKDSDLEIYQDLLN